MEEDYSNLSDEELIKAYQDSLSAEPQPQMQTATEPQMQSAPMQGAPAPAQPDYDSMSDEELIAAYRASLQEPQQTQAEAAAPGETPPQGRASTSAEILERTGREMGSPFWAGVKGAVSGAFEGAAKGAARAVKSGVQGLVVAPVTGAMRLAGTPARAFGYDGIHRLADAVDSGYANFGADVLDYGYEDALTDIGDAGAKVTGIAGSLGGLALGGGAAGMAAKLAGGGKIATAVARNFLPVMFGNEAAVQTYDTAKRTAGENREPFDEKRALALSAVNGLIHFAGFKAFENQSLKKMLRIGPEIDVKMPAFLNEARAGGAEGFTGLVRGIRNGMWKYTLAERGKGALKAGGIMGLQDMLSDIPMQMAEGADLDDIDLGRIGEKGLHGAGEGALMEGLMGGAAMLRSQKDAEKFMADRVYRTGYKVSLPDGGTREIPALLQTRLGRSFLAKQNPDALNRVIDIANHAGTATPEELDAAYLPPDMTKAEVKRLAEDYDADLAEAEGRQRTADGISEGAYGAGRRTVEENRAALERAQRANNDQQGREDAADNAREMKRGYMSDEEMLRREEAYPRPERAEEPVMDEHATREEEVAAAFNSPEFSERERAQKRSRKAEILAERARADEEYRMAQEEQERSIAERAAEKRAEDERLNVAVDELRKAELEAKRPRTEEWPEYVAWLQRFGRRDTDKNWNRFVAENDLDPSLRIDRGRNATPSPQNRAGGGVDGAGARTEAETGKESGVTAERVEGVSGAATEAVAREPTEKSYKSWLEWLNLNDTQIRREQFFNQFSDNPEVRADAKDYVDTMERWNSGEDVKLSGKTVPIHTKPILMPEGKTPKGSKKIEAEAVPGTQETPAEPPVAKRPNRLRRKQPNNFRHPGDNRLRPAVPDIDQQPIQETKDETGNVRNEAPAQQAAQDAGRDGQQPPPEAGARPLEGAEAGGEASDAGVVEAAAKPQRGENLRGYSYEDYGAPPNMDEATRDTEPGGTGDALGAALLRYAKDNKGLLRIPQSKDDPLWDWYQSFSDGNARKNRRGDFVALFGMNARKGRNDNFIEEMSDPELAAALKGLVERRGIEAVPEAFLEARRKYADWVAKKHAAAREAKAEREMRSAFDYDALAAAREGADAEWDSAIGDIQSGEGGFFRTDEYIKPFTRDNLQRAKKGDIIHFDHDENHFELDGYDPETGVMTVWREGADSKSRFRVSDTKIEEIKDDAGREEVADEDHAGDAGGERKAASAGAGADAGEAGRDAADRKRAARGGEGFALESATAEELKAERERNRQRAEIKKRQEAPLKGSGAVNVQPEMDLGQTGQQDLFSPIVEKPTQKPAKTAPATSPASAQERIAKSYADYVEEPVPEWAKRLSAKDAEEYARLLEDAQTRGVEDDGGDALDALEAFERAHDNRLRPAKDARGTRGKAPASAPNAEGTTTPPKSAKPAEGGKSASGATPAEWPKGWEHGKSLDGYAKATDADISALKPGDEVAVAHTSIGEFRAKQAIFAKVRSVGREYDGSDNADVFIGDYKDGWGYDQNARFKKSDIIGIRRAAAAKSAPAAPTPDMKRKATAAMRILGADAGKDAAALEAELRRMEERGQTASGPGRRKAEALRDLAAYKRAVGTSEVSVEEIAEGRQRDAEQRIIEGDGDTLPSEDFYGRRQSRGKGEMPAKWTDAAKRPLERVARALRNVVTVGGKRLKVSFADRPENADGQTRKSISGVFTGTAADYANRSRQGGVDDGPSLLKIGTGEGNQAYGYGLYGSNRRGVGITYAKSDVGRKGNGKLPFLRGIDGAGTKKNGVLMEKPRKEDYNLDLQYWADIIAWESPNERIALQTAKKYGEAIESYLEAYIKDYEFANDVPSEHLYEQTFFTNRAPGDESHLLKWYDAISDANWDRVIAQAEKEGLREKLKGAWWLRFNGDLEHFITDNGNSGDAIYESLSRLLGSPQAASEFLYRAGIDGVKYPVDSYGGKGVKDGDKAGWNYVAFSDEHIRVDHKWTDGELRYMKNADGAVVGEYDAAKGEIRLYPGATVADVVHEFTHPLVDFARAEANAGRGELLGKINQIIDAERATWEQPVREAYKDKSNDTILEEIFTHAMGEKGADLFGKSTKTLQGRRWYNRLWEAIKGVWQDFATKMGWNRADLRGLEKMSPEDAAQRILGEMAKGRNFGDAADGRVENNRRAQSEGVREARRVAAPGTAIMDEKRTTGERAVERFYDRTAPVKDFQDEIGGVEEKVRKSDGYTDHRTSTDLVAAINKANGRVEYELRDLERRVNAVEKDINKARLAKQETDDLMRDFNLFLVSEHAAERNRSHADEHGVKYTSDYYHGIGKVNFKGSEIGFSEDAAKKIIKPYLRDKYGANFSHFEDAAKKVYEIAAAELKRRYDGDLLAKSDYDFYDSRIHDPSGAPGRWAHFVPLKTDRAKLGIDDAEWSGLGAGFHRSEYRKARGRGETVAELAPFTDLVMQAEQGIRKSVRNEVANVEANLMRHATDTRGFKDANGNSLVAEIVPGEDVAHHGKNYQFTFGDGSSVVADGAMRLAGSHPEIHLFKQGGRLMAIRYVKGRHGRGLEVAKATSGDNVEGWGDGILSKVPKITSFMSAMRTQYSPEFTISNWLADSLEAAQALVGRYGVWDGAKAFGKAVAAEVRNAKDVWRYVSGRELHGDVKKAVEAGLLTKGGVASEGFEGREKSIRSRIEQFRREGEGFMRLKAEDKVKWAVEHVLNYLSMANEFMEYSTRMGLFSALHNKNVPINEAVKFARNATVNFNRKGTLMPIVNGLYMFANASVQGAVRSGQAFKESFQKLPDDGSGWGKHKIKGDLVYLLSAVGVAQAVMDHFIGDDEEREKAGGRNARNRSEYDRKHNVGIPLPGGRNMPIARFRGPYAAVPYIAQNAMRAVLGDAEPKDVAWTLAREVSDQATDLVGGNGILNDRNEVDWSLVGQSAAPSLLDPVVQLASGKDYKGDNRLRRKFDDALPDSWNGKRSTPAPAKFIVRSANWLTGGNSLRKGMIDISPEDAQLVWETIMGGLGRDIGNVISTVQNIAQTATGGKPERLLSDIPIARRLIREYPESTGRYYDAIDEYERDKAEFKKTTEMKRRAELKKKHPYLSAGKGRVDSLIKRVKEYGHLARGEVKVGKRWVEPKTPRTEEKKAEFREKQLRMQATVLRILGK